MTAFEFVSINPFVGTNLRCPSARYLQTTKLRWKDGCGRTLTQVISQLEELKILAGSGRLLFPSTTNRDRPISENTVTYAIARMGFKGQMTGHGFCSVASTILNEQGYRHDVIERQLAHAEKNQVRAAYNRAEYLPERKKMMRDWADYLDKLKAGAAIISLLTRQSNR
ncbi:tyrosine-type recombinase/integrase [Ferribacterium limneticum]|uniref:tyrosine-type recombinase/integrase n=1 Tax=Ferribacterium limneticum TaxID=76259 RepID=UPI00384C4BDC